MPPFAGSGASQAIEDAYTLAVLLSHRLVTRSNTVKALETFSSVRVPIATMISEISRRNGRRHSLREDESDAFVDNLEKLGEKISRDLIIATDYDPMTDVKRAVELLEDRLARE